MDLSLGHIGMMNLGNRIVPGDGLVPGVRSATGAGPPLGERRDHCGGGPVFEVGRRLDVRRKVLDDLADVAVLARRRLGSSGIR